MRWLIPSLAALLLLAVATFAACSSGPDYGPSASPEVRAAIDASTPEQRERIVGLRKLLADDREALEAYDTLLVVLPAADDASPSPTPTAAVTASPSPTPSPRPTPPPAATAASLSPADEAVSLIVDIYGAPPRELCSALAEGRVPPLSEVNNYWNPALYAGQDTSGAAMRTATETATTACRLTNGGG